MPKIYDNIENQLSNGLADTLKVSKRGVFCVGYFKKNNFDNSKRCIYKKKNGLTIFHQFWPQNSKSIIDEIDNVLAIHYNFTD